MNLENKQTMLKQKERELSERKGFREFYVKVMEEFNDRCDLIEKVKQKAHKEKVTELRKSWSLRSKLDQLQIAFEKE